MAMYAETVQQLVDCLHTGFILETEIGGEFPPSIYQIGGNFKLLGGTSLERRNTANSL